MLVEMRPISSVHPYENNPRQNDAAVDAVAASLREYGFRQPIVVDEDGVIMVGHTRYKAAVKLGLGRVPVHVAVGLSPAQAKAYRIADNQTATLSSWDDDKLPLELAALQQLDFDLNLTGFGADELPWCKTSATGLVPRRIGSRWIGRRHSRRFQPFLLPSLRRLSYSLLGWRLF
jgi:ParB-like chromosome segregation protein Spo0J